MSEHEIAPPVRIDSRIRTRETLGLGVRARTENMKRLPARELKAGRVHLRVVDEVDAARPRVRGDCETVERPCPFVGCRHNLYLDVNPDTGSIKFNFPDKEPDEIDPERSCSLDIAELGGATLEDVGRLANFTRERARQIEEKVVARLQAQARRTTSEAALLRDYCESPADVPPRPGRGGGPKNGGSILERVDTFGDDADAEDADRHEMSGVSFFGDAKDEHVTRSIWTMFSRWQNSRGFACQSAMSIKVSQSLARRRALAGETVKPPTPVKEEEDMATKKRGEMLDIVLEAFKKLEVSYRRAPTTREVFDELGEAKAKSVGNVQMALKRLGQKGLITYGGGRAKSAGVPPVKAKPPAPAPKKTRAAKPRVANGGGHTDQSVRDAIATLTARRDALAEKVAALTIAIEALA